MNLIYKAIFLKNEFYAYLLINQII